MAVKMVKVNLLQDQQSSGEVKRVVRKASGITQLLLMLAIAGFALVTVISLDFYSATKDSRNVAAQLLQEQQRADELKKLTARREEWQNRNRQSMTELP